MYTLHDIIEKLILIEQDGVKMYSNIADKAKNSNIMLSVMAKTLANEEFRHVKYYENLKSTVKTEENIEIDFFLYDKVVKLLYEFREKVIIPELEDVYELIKYALYFEKKNIALLLDIQGRLVVNIQDAAKERYEVITKLIAEERKHEKDLEAYLYRTH